MLIFRIINGKKLNFRLETSLKYLRKNHFKEPNNWQAVQSRNYGIGLVDVYSHRSRCQPSQTLPSDSGCSCCYCCRNRNATRASRHYSTWPRYIFNSSSYKNRLFNIQCFSNDGSASLIGQRQYSSSTKEVGVHFGIMKFDGLPALCPSPAVAFDIFSHLRNAFVAYIIRLKYDKTFTTDSLLVGAKQAIFTVSSAIAKGSYELLKDLVEEKAAIEIEYNCRNMSEGKRRLIAIDEQDFIDLPPGFEKLNNIHLKSLRILHEKNGRSWLEASVVLFCLQNAHQFVEFGDLSVKEFLEKVNKHMQLCYYVFIREVDSTKDLESDWIVSKLEHFNYQSEME